MSMQRTIAGLFLVAAAALLLAWWTRDAGDSTTPAGPLSSTSAGTAPSAASSSSAALEEAPSAAQRGAGKVARSAAAPSPVGDAAVAPEERLGALRALAKAAAVARERAAQRAASAPVFPADRDGIVAAMGAAKAALKECYEPWARLNPELQGRMTTSFVIGAGGGPVASAHIAEGGLGSEALDGCVVSVLEGELRFEAPSSGSEIKVNYPLTFASASEPEQASEGD